MLTVIEIDTDLNTYLTENLNTHAGNNPRGFELRHRQDKTSVWVVEARGQRAECLIETREGKQYVVYGLKKKSLRGRWRKPKGVE
jgi:hypothetical protein